MKAASLSLLLVLAGCAGAIPVPADARTVVVSLIAVDCADCGNEMVADLRERPGVYKAGFERKSAEITVTASPTFDVFTAVRQLAAQKGFQAILGAGQGHYEKGPDFPSGADVNLIAGGGADLPELTPLLARGKVTIVDFSASWCGPCRKVDQHMVDLLGKRADVAYRRIDIVDWDTPVAQRYLKSVPQLPYVIVFDPAGGRVKELSGLDLGGLDAAIAKAAPR